MFTDVDVRGVPRGRCNREKCECDGFTRSSAETSVGGSGAAQWGWCCYCGHPPVCHARIERKVFDDGDTTLDSEHHAQSPPPHDPPTHHEHIEVAQPRTDVHVLDPTEETPRSTGPENNGQENSVSPAGKAHLCTPVHSSGQKRVHSDEDTSDSDASTSEKRVLLQKVANLEDDMRNLKRRLVDEQPPSRSQACMEEEKNILVLEAAKTATGEEQTCNHLDEIEALQNTIISLHEELRQTREELDKAYQCLDAEKMVKQLKHLLDRARSPAEPVGVTPAPKVDIGNGVFVEEGLLKRLHLDANNSGSRFARSLLKALFTKEELKGKSLFGRPSNAHKGLRQKEPLDPKRLKAILEYTTRNFHVLPMQLKNSLSSLLTRGS